MSSRIKWWGYLHTNRTVQVKRFFDDPRDIEEAQESPFVAAVTPVFLAENREQAMLEATRLLNP